jgi:hypothetical protein
LTVPNPAPPARPGRARPAGVPELRQGVAPRWPSGEKAGGRASAEVTLEPDGRIGLARLIEGEAPWSDALIGALKTWRFAAPPEDAVLSFRVEVAFVPGRGREADQVSLRATGLQRSDLLAGPERAAPEAAAEAQAPGPTGAGIPAAGQTEAQAPGPEPSEPSTPPAPPGEPPAAAATTGAGTEAAPQATAPAPPMPPPTAARSTPATPPGAAPAPGSAPPVAPTPPGSATPSSSATPPGSAMPSPAQMPPGAVPPSAQADAAAAPPVEVITAPPPPPPPENGVSAIRDVTLEPGVPDLVRGRRPVAPPFARMAGVDGTVEVEFSVSAAGTTAVRSVSGPELLKPAAQDAIASWVFRRTRADRAYLVAVLVYAADKATAVVRPEAVPGTPPPPGPGAEPTVPSPAPPPPKAPTPPRS